MLYKLFYGEFSFLLLLSLANASDWLPWRGDWWWLRKGEEGSWAPPPPALSIDVCSKFYILLSLPWFPYPRREPKWSLSLCQPWEEGKQPRGRFSCPKSFQHLLGEREGSCAAFGLQFHFNFFFFLRLPLNIQSITLAQCMSPKILQGFHGLGRRVVTVSLAVTWPGASLLAHTNKPASWLLSCPPQPQPVSLLHSVTLPEALADGLKAQRLELDPCRGGHRQRMDGQVPTQRGIFTSSAYAPLGLVQSVPSGKCWEQSSLPTCRGEGGGSLLPVTCIFFLLYERHFIRPSTHDLCSLRPQVRCLGRPNACGSESA